RYMMCFTYFFFSSRRRHTRFSRDWSSDVCSSDLGALTPRQGAVSVREFGRRHPGKVVLLLGSEGHGLSEEALAVSDVAVRIPIAEHVDSLNVAVAGAIACYELAEQARLGER